MLARQLRLAAPMGSRSCAFLTKMKTMEGEATKLAATMPEELKGIALGGKQISADLEDFAKTRPDLYKECIAKIQEADKPGIRPTVAAAKDPNACKYTVEGTMGYDLMRIVSKADRRMRLVSELEVTLTAADKDAIKKMLTDKAIEGGVDPKAVDMSVPDKMSLSL